MSLNFRNNQTDKKARQAKDKANPAKQGSEIEKYSEKARKRKKRRVVRDGAKGVTPQLELIPFQLQSQVVRDKRGKRRLKISSKSPTIVVTKKVITPPIVPSQKSSCNFGNLHVNDC